MMNEDDLPAEALAVPGCPGCARLLRRVKKLEEAFRKMETEVRELRDLVLKLQARLDQNSSNSSKPPSSDPPGKPPPAGREPSGRKPGGQPGHEGHHRERLPKECVGRTVTYVPEKCEACGGALSKKSGPRDPAPRWHQVTELPPLVVEVTEHQGHGRACGRCGHVTWAEIPAEVRAHVIGPNFAAVLSYLSGRCHESKRTVQEVAAAVFGARVSLGAVAHLEREMQAALSPGYTEAKAAVGEAPAKNVDETGWFQRGVLRWLWLAATEQAACFQIHERRGRKGLTALLGETVKGIVGSDRWGAYARLALEARQVCWAHLKRDFQGLIDGGVASAAKTGRRGVRVTADLFRVWGEFKAGTIDRATLQARMAPVRKRMERVLRYGRDGPDLKTARFSKRILKIYPALWTFVDREGVEPTNNHAERQLRPAVLWRKRSFGNHSEDGCRFTERILTAVQTLRLQGRPVLPYLREAIVAHRAHSAPPPLILLAEG